jgi:hypothetical protein
MLSVSTVLALAWLHILFRDCRYQLLVSSVFDRAFVTGTEYFFGDFFYFLKANAGIFIKIKPQRSFSKSGSGHGAWDPTILHLILSFSAVSLFVDCKN